MRSSLSPCLRRAPSAPRAADCAALLLTLVLAACGGSSEGTIDPRVQALRSVTRVAIGVESPGANCPTGGSRIGAGLDLDGSGALEASEATSVQYVCHGGAGSTGATGAAGTTGSAGTPGAAGASGAAGLTSLVAVIVEPAGLHCAAGGSRIDVGVDRDADGILGIAEVTSTDYVCGGLDGSNGAAGTNGANGSNGTDGLNSLVAIAAEAAGANCAYGGSKITAGLDTNRNGSLGAGEVTSTTYVCNPAPAGLAWVHVTGTAVQAQPNTGYLADSSSVVTLTLPASPALGDVTRVTGVGSGGWTVAQNAGQSIHLGASEFSARDQVRPWRGVAASADGSLVVAAVYGDRLRRSTDSGTTWAPIGAVGNWVSVASSADGVRLVAGQLGGDIWTSADSGLTWTPHGFASDWYALTSSADGAKLVAGDFQNGFLYTSTDYGATWTPRDSQRVWTSIASSTDGTKLVASAYGGGGDFLYVSTDSGVTWTPRASFQIWRGVASSADGMRLAATAFPGRLWVSSDAGLTWSAREATQQWHYVASSADGRRLVASVYGERVYRSSDFGLTWQPIGPSALWWGVATSSDGNVAIASPDGDHVHNEGAPLQSTLGIAGSVSGARYESIELQYVGGGVFTTLGSLGNLQLR